MTQDLGFWVERYRPRKVADLILPPRIKASLQAFVDQGELPCMILEGGPGCGKTASAKAMCDELGCDWILINGSDESGIDVLRTKVRDFASTSSIGSEARHKVVIFDEADYLNPNSTQPALRGFIDEFKQVCRFIFTCNYVSRIIEPLHSRCAMVTFRFSREEAVQMMAAFMGLCMRVLTENGATFDPPVLAALITKYFPDMRRLLNELQGYAARGPVDSGILATSPSAKVELLVGHLRDKDFKAIRQYFAANHDSPAEFFTSLYGAMSDHLAPQSVPSATVILADYQYKAAFAMNQEINSVACCVQLMLDCTFR